MIYFDTSYLVRLYVADPGWEKVQAMAKSDRVACALHGKAEAIAAFHRKFREKVLSKPSFQALLKQFDSDCTADAIEWLPITPDIMKRVRECYERLPATVPLRAADAMHLACASGAGIAELYSNDAHLLAGGPFFGIKTRNIL